VRRVRGETRGPTEELLPAEARRKQKRGCCCDVCCAVGLRPHCVLCVGDRIRCGLPHHAAKVVRIVGVRGALGWNLWAGMVV